MMRDEIFGPVAAIQRFDSEEDVIERANDTEYGLVAYLFRAISPAVFISERLDFGMIGLNRGLVSGSRGRVRRMKQSGLGREGAREGMMEYLEAQYVSVAW